MSQTNEKHKKKQNFDTMWVDRYRPRKLCDIVGHDDVKVVIGNALEQGNLPHLLFHGDSGTGKTSTTHAIIQELYGYDRSNVLELNASDENGINIVREKIIKFAKLGVVPSHGKKQRFKIIVLDEADSMTNEAQTALKKVMEKTCNETRFIIICNHINEMNNAIRSRCAEFRFARIHPEKIMARMKMIASLENLAVKDDNVYKEIIKVCKGDARRCINMLQKLMHASNHKNITKREEIVNELICDMDRSIIDRFISNKRERGILEVDDVYKSSSIPQANEFDKHWNMLHKNVNACKLNDIAQNISDMGFPTKNVLECFCEKVVKSRMSEKAKSRIVLYIAEAEKMLVCGVSSKMQILGVLAYIVTVKNECNRVTKT